MSIAISFVIISCIFIFLIAIYGLCWLILQNTKYIEDCLINKYNLNLIKYELISRKLSALIKIYGSDTIDNIEKMPKRYIARDLLKLKEILK